MPSTRQAVFWILVISIVGSHVSCDVQLKLLHVLFRHGEKVPHREYQNYPNDPHRNHSYYPLGSGDLTNEGKMREYKIGKVLRERYDQFFGENYWPSLIYARSTDIPRTQMSLQLVLAGLFPPSNKQTWNAHLPWTPASMFSVPYDEDYLLFPHYCPRYKEVYDRFLRQDDIQEIVNKYQNIMTYLTEYTGKTINSTSAVYYLYNLLKEERAENLTLPEWTKQVYPNPMKEITALDFNLRSYTKNLKRLNGGILLRKITDDIKELRVGKLRPADRKAFFFSAHELNVAGFVRTLGTDDPVLPAYGSTIILETLQDVNGTYYIRILLWTGVTERLITQKVPGCSEMCPLVQFLKIMEDVIPNDAEYYCYGSKLQNFSRRNTNEHSAANFIGQTYWQLGLVVILLIRSVIR